MLFQVNKKRSETDNILTGLNRLDAGRMFPLAGEPRTTGKWGGMRGSVMVSGNTEMRRDIFTLNIVNIWNSHSRRAAKAHSLNAFKTLTDRCKDIKRMKGNGDRVRKCI